MNERIHLHGKNLYCYIVCFFSLILAFYYIFTITGFQMRYLSHLLYDKSHLSAVTRLLSQYILRKALFSVILLLVALIMFYLFYFSYFHLAYLKLSIICLLGISYIYTLSETDTIFYIGTTQGQLWQNSSLISCLFLLFFFTFEIFDPYLASITFRFIVVTTLLLSGVSLLMLDQRYTWNLAIFPYIFLIFSGCLVVFLILSLKDRMYRNLLRAFPVIGASIYLMYVNYVWRLRDYTISVLNRRNTLYEITDFAVLITVLYIVLTTVIHMRGSLLHSRDLNRKMAELESSKYLLLGIIYSNVKNYLFSARTSLDTLQEQKTLSDDSRKAITRLRGELDNIDTLYNQVHNYTIFSGNTATLSLCHVNIDLFFRLLSEKLAYSGLLTNGDSMQYGRGNGFTDLYPDYLLQTIEDLIIFLRCQDPEGRLSITTENTASQVQFFLNYNAPEALQFHPTDRKRHTLHPESGALPDLNSLDYIISTLRHQLTACGGSVKVLNDRHFQLRLTFPVASHNPPAYSCNRSICKAEGAKAIPHLLVLSSDEEQLEQLRKMLSFDQYHITIANDGDYFMEHPQELSRYSLLIIGNLYRNVYFRDFYQLVRNDYSMTTLPILLLLPHLYAENSFYIRSTINDYLTPPYSQVSLEKKIHSLLTVKQTADIALEAQLEFWQSQINPHFVFNSINSIMHMCIKEPMTAYELLGDFSEYLRGHLLSLSLDKTFSIQKEIDLISAYLQIEKARFGDKIHYELDVDCDKDFPILPLLIEPLVENSIKHSPMHETGVSVTVQIFQIKNQLLIRVDDDGDGMSQDTVDQILTNTFESNSIGLSNVCSRLRHYYHTAPVIESTIGSGTTVQFTIEQRRSLI